MKINKKSVARKIKPEYLYQNKQIEIMQSSKELKVELTMPEYKALVASALAGRGLVKWMNEDQDIFKFMVDGQKENVLEKFEETKLTY